jgi:hypothetical protein
MDEITKSLIHHIQLLATPIGANQQDVPMTSPLQTNFPAETHLFTANNQTPDLAFQLAQATHELQTLKLSLTSDTFLLLRTIHNALFPFSCLTSPIILSHLLSQILSTSPNRLLPIDSSLLMSPFKRFKMFIDRWGDLSSTDTMQRGVNGDYDAARQLRSDIQIEVMNIRGELVGLWEVVERRCVVDGWMEGVVRECLG